ncbi:uncharacterized protein HMPREF1541_07603 [Cyphellophora europaea CBS 101466]|uniref:Uncharacterized protein n=1 Tax=Cyphellophora europaea (strain CBS 101466) TaxID=1220924 RepID=W2RNT1_CYPE1|nr:uncharacterized protein HMPREF1541_07603 [Cyphellophora europaea CBS 101466]ETN37980.1 hypothetical protein HMPREF1541_07603 [Cyphellophora europaea CBS 101466]
MSYAANPRASGNHPASADPNVPQESIGAIASDSLAADSIKQGGDFANQDPNAVPLGVSGSKSTLNTTDTSGAVPLSAAASGTAREKQQAQSAGSDERGVTGLKYPDATGQPGFSGAHTGEGGYHGSPAADRQGGGYTTQPAGASDFGATTTSTSDVDSSQIRSGSAAVSSSNNNTNTTSGSTSTNQAQSASTSGTTGIRPHVDAAPNYAARVSGAIDNDNERQPKGDNLVEGGDIPAGKKTFTGDVGGPKDPGRLAEQRFEGINANVPGGGTDRDRQGERDVGGQYGALEGSERI